MQPVPIAELAAGMVLARDVDNIDDYLMLVKGTTLTDSQIALLHRWKIAEVFVEPPKPPEEPANDAPPAAAEDEWLKEARARLDARFEGRLVTPFMQSLYNAAEKRLVQPPLGDPE